MADLIVKSQAITALRPHPNADRLEIAEVGGWQCVVVKDTYREGDVVVHVPPETLVPKALAVRLGIDGYLSFSHGKPDFGRVRAARLRGEVSHGFVFSDDRFTVAGEDAVAAFGFQKYEPPPNLFAGNRMPEYAGFDKYTSIENIKNFLDVFHEGEEVVFTEKIHGTNSRIGHIMVRDKARGELVPRIAVGTHRTQIEVSDEGKEGSLYGYPLTLEGVRRALWMPAVEKGNEVLEGASPNVNRILYGEIFGPRINDYHYGQTSPAYRAFDIKEGQAFLDYDEFVAQCAAFDIATAPALYRGPFSLDAVDAFTNRWNGGKSQVGTNPDQLREGIVIRPVKERTHPEIGRVILKAIADSYLTRGKGTENQ